MNKWLELILGLVLVVVPIVFALMFPAWGLATLSFIMGGLVVLVVLIGVMFVMLGISDFSA